MRLNLISAVNFFVAVIGLASASCTIDPSVGPERSTLPVAPRDAGPEASSESGAVGTVVFSRDIRPIMNREADDVRGRGCKGCHYPGQGTQEGLFQSGLKLDTLGHLRQGGGSTGTDIVVPGNPDKSGIIQKLEGTYAFGARMPKNGPYWTKEDIAILRTWIAEGAHGEDSE